MTNHNLTHEQVYLNLSNEVVAMVYDVDRASIEFSRIAKNKLLNAKLLTSSEEKDLGVPRSSLNDSYPAFKLNSTVYKPLSQHEVQELNRVFTNASY